MISLFYIGERLIKGNCVLFKMVVPEGDKAQMNAAVPFSFFHPSPL